MTSKGTKSRGRGGVSLVSGSSKGDGRAVPEEGRLGNGVERPESVLQFTVFGPPVPKQRPRVVRNRRLSRNVMTYTPKPTREYEKLVILIAGMASAVWRKDHRESWPTAVRYDVELRFFCQDNRRRDLDNLAKALTDGMTGVLWDDDSQIDRLTAEKCFDKETPRAEITVRAR